MVVLWGSTCARLQPLHASLEQEHSVRLASIHVGASGNSPCLGLSCKWLNTSKVLVLDGCSSRFTQPNRTALSWLSFRAAATELLYCIYAQLNGSHFLPAACLLFVQCLDVWFCENHSVCSTVWRGFVWNKAVIHLEVQKYHLICINSVLNELVRLRFSVILNLNDSEFAKMNNMITLMARF